MSCPRRIRKEMKKMPDKMRDILYQAASDLGISLTQGQLDSFDKYAAMIRERNKAVNLTSILDDEGMAIKHFADSLSLVQFIDNPEASIIDIGTGAGFPGIPLKIALPKLRLTLMDALNKRLVFLGEVSEELALGDVEFVHARAEDGGRDKSYREMFDIATARAVAPLPVLCEYCLPFVRKGGIFLAMKAHSEDELQSSKNAIKMLGGCIEKVSEFSLPGTDMTRSVIVVRKTKNTPSRYPRKAGQPAKNPLK